jgi:hypothetical protein
MASIKPVPAKTAKPAAKVAAKVAAPVAVKRGFPARKTADGEAVPKKPLTKAEAKEKAEAAAARVALVTHQAPDGFKSCTFDLKFRTLHDGTIDPQVKCEAISGKWDNPEARRVDMSLYDVQTITGVVSRLSAIMYASNLARRLPADAAFSIIGRAGANSEGNLIFSFRQIARGKATKSGITWIPYTDKADPLYRKFRRATRLLRGAFVDAKPMPSISEVKAMAKAKLGKDESL